MACSSRAARAEVAPLARGVEAPLRRRQAGSRPAGAGPERPHPVRVRPPARRARQGRNGPCGARSGPPRARSRRRWPRPGRAPPRQRGGPHPGRRGGRRPRRSGPAPAPGRDSRRARRRTARARSHSARITRSIPSSNVGSGTSAASPARSGRPIRTARSTASQAGLQRAGEVRGQALGTGIRDHQPAPGDVVQHSRAELERPPVPAPAVLVGVQPHRLAAGPLRPRHRDGTVSVHRRLRPVVRQVEDHPRLRAGRGPRSPRPHDGAA